MNFQNHIPQKTVDKIALPRLLDSLSNVHRIICGSDHSFALKANSEIYAWGNNNRGQLGIPIISVDSFGALENLGIITVPTLIESLLSKEIDRLATGSDHTFAWSLQSGEVYAWGSGAFGKLGLGDRENHASPMLLECFKEASAVGMKVCEVACGDNHTLAVLENAEENNHKLFVWGHSKSWQLGLDGDNTDDVLEPHAIDPDPFDETVLFVAACNNYSCSIIENGDIYTWGSGEFGRLGYETETRQQKVPRQVSGLDQIIKVSLGFYHAAAINQTGQVFSWGRGINGQLGHGEVPNEDYPKQVKMLSNTKIIDICCGENHTVAVSDIGEAFSWGAGQVGQLGHGDFMRQTLPMKIASLEDKMVVQVSAGRKHTAALTTTGHVYVWGSNEYGQLGLKNLGVSHSKKLSQVIPDKIYSARSYSQNESPNNHQFFLERADDHHPSLPDNLTFSPLNHISSQKIEIKKNIMSSGKKSSEVQSLINENKFLQNRVKDLEMKMDIGTMRQQQEIAYDIMNEYMKVLEQEFAAKNGEGATQIIMKNSKIDNLNTQFKQKICELETNDNLTITFCINTFDRICELQKKANYSVI